MKKLDRAVVFAVLYLAQALLLTNPAFAFRDGGPITSVGMRQENREVANASTGTIRVEGKLKCDLGSSNTGEGCTLKLEEDRTGKVYTLIEANEAMRLYQSGSRNVAIEGSAAGDDAIQVKRAETL